MNYRTMIEKAVNHMETHLIDPLTNKICSDHVGYSEFHFQKIFKGVVGYSPMDYIRKRRLSEAVILLDQGDMTVFQVAFQVGYNSQEHFIRAFKAEHGITPNGYRKTRSSLHLMKAYGGFKDPQVLVPELVQLKDLRLRCHVFETDDKNRHHDIPRFWNIYHRNALYKAFTDDEDRVDYGWLERTGEDSLRYWIGCEPNGQALEVGQELVIPKGTYARYQSPKADAFTFVETIHETWAYILDRGLRDRDLKSIGPYAFECYQENSRSYSEEIYIPIEKEDCE